MEEKINKLKNWHWLLKIVGAFLVALIGGVWTLAIHYSDYQNHEKELLDTIKTTQQMSLKSVIWNDEIPLPERASACDVYLNAGYNSLTKKECESIIEKGTEQGIFSYIEMEGKYEYIRNNSYNSSYNLAILYAS